MSNSVPRGWELTTIGNVGRVVTGSTPSTQEPAYWGGEVPFISPADFNGSVYVKKTQRNLTKLGASKSRLLPKDAVLVTCIGSLGGIAMAPSECTTNQQINAVVPSAENDSRYCFYNILFNIEELTKNAGTTTIPIINKSTFELINLLLPPLPEQQKIAAILTAVDEVIASTQAQISKLKDLKTAMMQELLTKGIGHTEFKDSPVGRIPATWGFKRLQDVATIQTGVAKNSKLEGDLVDIPYLRVANVQDGYLDLTEIKLISIEKSRVQRFLLQPEDVLVNEGGDFDKLGRGHVWHGQIDPCIHQNHVFVVRTDNKYLLPLFFNFLSGAEIGKNYYLGCAKQTTNLASINSTQLKQFPVLLPSIEEQKDICKHLQAVDSKLELLKLNLERKQNVKKALMQDLLTGKVRVQVN